MATKVNATHAQDLSIAKQLGEAVEGKNSAFKEAVKGGNQGEINSAKIDMDQAQQNMMGFMTAKDKEHDMIMRLIAMISD